MSADFPARSACPTWWARPPAGCPNRPPPMPLPGRRSGPCPLSGAAGASPGGRVLRFPAAAPCGSISREGFPLSIIFEDIIPIPPNFVQGSNRTARKNPGQGKCIVPLLRKRKRTPRLGCPFIWSGQRGSNSLPGIPQMAFVHLQEPCLTSAFICAPGARWRQRVRPSRKRKRTPRSDSSHRYIF